MVVIAIIGITAAVAVPNLMDAIRAREAEGQVKDVKAHLLRARNRARNAVCTMHITVNPTNIQVGPDPGDPAADCVALQTLQYELGDHVTANAFSVGGTPTNPLVLNTDGGTDYVERAQLVITNTYSGETTMLELWPAIGTVAEAS